MSSLNSQIKEAIDLFDIDSARLLLRDALKEADAETYYLASKVAIDPQQRIEFLQKSTQLDPFHELSRRELALAISSIHNSATQGNYTSNSKLVSLPQVPIIQESHSSTMLADERLEELEIQYRTEVESTQLTQNIGIAITILGIFTLPFGVGILLVIIGVYLVARIETKRTKLKTQITQLKERENRKEFQRLSSTAQIANNNGQESYKSILLITKVERTRKLISVFGILQKGEFFANDQLTIVSDGRFIFSSSLLASPTDVTKYLQTDGKLNTRELFRDRRSGQIKPPNVSSTTILGFNAPSTVIISPGMLIVKLN